MELQCPECGHEYEVDAAEMEDSTCPECGFGPDKCNHPQGYRDSERVYDHGEGQRVERVFCSKCGLPVTEF